MHNLMHDLTFVWRNVRKRPATSLLIVLTLALGIGVNTAIFSMTWHVLLAPLPYLDGDRLVKLEQQETTNASDNIPWSLPTIVDLREQNSVFSAVLQYFQESYTLYSSNGPFQVDSGAVDGNFFATLGLAPAMGRLFTAGDDRIGAAPAMLLGNKFWVEKFGGSPDVLGSTMEMNGYTYTVVGILPDIPPYPRANDVWVTTANDWVMATEQVRDGRQVQVVSHVFGKLLDGVSREQVRQDLTLFAGRLVNSYPDVYVEGAGYSIASQPLKQVITGSSARTVGLLMALATLVVLIACANFANLTLAGMLTRSQELAVREAVGADPGRIRRQLITENIVVSVLGGFAGLALTVLALGFITDFASIYTPLATEISIDARVLWFCLTLTLVVGLASAGIASMQKRDINRALKDGGDKTTATAGSKQLRDLLLAVQCALAFVMLTSTALMTSSLYALVNQPTGYDIDGVVVLSTVMRGVDPSTMWPERDMMLQVLEEARALPGVTVVSLSGLPLLQGPGFPPRPVLLEGGARSVFESFTTVSTGFFDMLGVPLLGGRQFAGTDDENAPEVVVVNESFAARYFPAGDAIGKRLSMTEGNSWLTIVGIVGDIRARDIDMPDIPMIYTHYSASPTQRINLYVKTRSNLLDTANSVKTIIQRLDPLQPIDAITPLEEVRDTWLAPTRLRTGVIAAFGVLALLVTLSGVIGVVSYNISQQVREIAVHMAIGANPGNIMTMFVSRGVKIYLFGLLLGFALMIVCAPAIEPLLYQTAAINVSIYLLSALVLTIAVLAALYIPSRKASQMSPMDALHVE